MSTSVVRELQDRLLDLTLSRPVPRVSWYLGRLAGFAAAATALAVLAVIPLMFYAPAGATLAWGASLAAELWIVAAACLTCVITLGQVTFALIVVAAFYVLSRAMSAIVLMSSGPAVDPTVWSSAVPRPRSHRGEPDPQRAIPSRATPGRDRPRDRRATR